MVMELRGGRAGAAYPTLQSNYKYSKISNVDSQDSEFDDQEIRKLHIDEAVVHRKREDAKGVATARCKVDENCILRDIQCATLCRHDAFGLIAFQYMMSLEDLFDKRKAVRRILI